LLEVIARKKIHLFVEVLEKLAPWFFALDHVNYARWLPIFIRDMKSLPDEVKDDFHRNWVITKTNKKFSSIPIDQAHEQNNAIVKGLGGVVGLTENPIAFRRWMVAGPEMSSLIRDFERDSLELDDGDDEISYAHHEQGMSTQLAFQKQVLSLIEVIKHFGNPFGDEFSELIALDTRTCADNSVKITVRTIEEVGRQQYEKYLKNVVQERTCSIQNPIKRNSLPLFKRQTPKATPKTVLQLAALKSDRSLFSRLYIVSQHREGDLDQFFKHENHPFPPSISEYGKLRSGKKSDLLQCLEVSNQSTPPTLFDAKVFDGAAVAHFLPTLSALTFCEYAENTFLSFLRNQLNTAKRIDMVWDVYRPESLKESTREKRGKGKRKKVSANTRLPQNWQAFMQDPFNKQELFSLLSEKVKDFNPPQDKNVLITSEEKVLVAGEASLTMPDCNHEEADTRILLHVLHALECGAKTVLVRTVDTDVVVLLIGKFSEFSQHALIDIWVSFGVGRSHRMYHINAMFNLLGECKAKALPMFHSFTGCDTTSSFSGRGKKSAWEAWKSYPNVTNAFVHITENPFDVLDTSSEVFQVLERFTVVMYDKTSTTYSVDTARRNLFGRQNRLIENIPPTQVRQYIHN